MVNERNVLGDVLVPCAHRTFPASRPAVHCDGGDESGATVCVTMTQEFLRHQRSLGNDLTARNEVSRFPGLKPGDSWCVPVEKWFESLGAGVAAPVWLEGTGEAALQVVGIQDLRAHAVDVPRDPGRLTR